MTTPRLVLITRRFWPLVGGAEAVMANLADECASRGIQVTLLTAQWEANWPSEIVYRGATVVRLPNPSIRFWGTYQYMRSIRQWLRANCDTYDLVYVSMLKHDAYAAISELRPRVPVVLRAEGAGLTGDCLWQLEANGGRRIKRKCLTADAIIGPSEAVVKELKAAGYPRPRVHYLPNGVPIPPPCTPKMKTAERQALAETHLALRLPHDDSPLVVYTGRLHEGKGLSHLLAAWETIAAARHDARLWLVGEGPLRNQLFEEIGARGLGGSVILTGAFDNVDELLVAADLYVLPSLEEGMSIALLEAMAAGLPIVATDIPGNRTLMTEGEHGLLVPVQEPGALAGAIDRLLGTPDEAAQLGRAARSRAQQEFSVAHMLDEHLTLFEALLEERPNP